MAADNTESQMRKGLLELCILGIIQRHKEAYPSDILEELKEAKLVVLEGTLYPLLSRLKNGGFLSYRWEESLSGPPTKVFRTHRKRHPVLRATPHHLERTQQSSKRFNYLTINTKLCSALYK